MAFDGTGYGSDGRIWGGEFLVADLKGFKRAAHLEYLPLPGGALAIKKPYRTAIGYLLALGMDLDYSLPLFQGMNEEEIDIIRGQVASGFNAPLTSSMGRLFDAVAALTGVRGVIEYEAQAAIDLETLASRETRRDRRLPVLGRRAGRRQRHQARPSSSRPSSRTCVRVPRKPVIAARFHNTVARMIVEVCQAISARTGLKGVALSGGVFQNRLLLEQAIARLELAGSGGLYPPPGALQRRRRLPGAGGYRPSQ